jgi:hypothetical protein
LVGANLGAPRPIGKHAAEDLGGVADKPEIARFTRRDDAETKRWGS